jgi:hypothetical protein
MARDLDPEKLSSPQVFLWRMIIFLIIAAFLALILYRQVSVAFMANPGLNGTIFFVAFVGIIMTFRQVIRLFPEIRWVNGYRMSDPGIEVRRQPVLLAPMAAMLRDRSEMALSTQTTRSLLDSIATRLDEAREITRYIIGLLVFLGLLGTFWGLISTVNAVGSTILSLDVGSGNSGVIFEDLKAGLAAPLSGMGTAFSSSLFGLAGSLVVGFLDLQAGQAQNRFYLNLEDWLSTRTDVEEAVVGRDGRGVSAADELRVSVERLTRMVQEGGGGRGSVAAMANLAEGIQGLVQHMRTEQQLIRDIVDSQKQQSEDMKRLLELLSGAVDVERAHETQD